MENNNIKISICIAVFNGEKYLKEQLESILKQSCKNIEIIIVDDCSIDGTKKLLKDFVKKYEFIKVYENEHNIGFINNFEKAISLSSGDYIALADQDDVWEFNKLEVLIDLIKDNDSLLVYSNALLVDNNLKSQNKTLLDSTVPMSGNNNLYFLHNNSISGNTIIFKKELKEKALPFPDNIGFHDIWLSFVASSNSNIIYSNQNLVKYRQHMDNVTNINKQKIKKTYKNKISAKIKSQKSFSLKLQNYIEYLEKDISNHKNLLLLKELNKEYLKFEKYWINFKLFNILYKNKNLLFFSKKKVGFIKILKMSIGIRLYKILPFI